MSQLAEFIMVLIGSFSVVLMLMSVFFFVLIDKYRKNIKIKQNEALNNLIVGQESERERLARDLHDEMGPQLSNILLNIDTIKVENQSLMQLVTDTKAELKYAINDIRKISHDLMSQSLKRYGLVAAIEELIDRQPAGSIRVEFFSNSTGLEYNDTIKSHLFKITQELVYNSNKYSESDKINIQLIIDEKQRTIAYSYKDNGKGNPDFKPDQAGLGLKNIKTRVDLINGTFVFRMDNGFMADITLKY